MNTQHEEAYIDLGVVFADFWKGIKKFWYLLILLPLIGILGVVGYQKIGYSPLYTAQATFTVRTTGSGIKNEIDTVYGFYYDQNTAEQIGLTFPYILESNVFKSGLKEALGREYIGGSISVSVIENSNLVTLNVVSADPDDAQEILNAVMVVYPEIARYVIGNNYFELIDSAQSGDTPFNTPNYQKGGLLGLLLGFAAACGIVFLYAVLKKTIRTEENVKQVMNRPCLAVLPELKKSPVITRLTKHELGYAENVYSLQNRLDFLMKKNNQKVLLVTSTVPSEGKTTLSLNLAIAMAQRGMKVLLIDGDLRKPSLYRSAGANKMKYALRDVLSGDVSLDEAAQYLQEFSLFYLGNRSRMKNSVAVIQSKEMEKLISQAREFADIVIIDTPPGGMLADTGIYCEYADSILMVIKQDWVGAAKVMDTIADFPGQGEKLIGCVLNMVKTGFAGYGYGYNGYGYGYTKYNHYQGRYYDGKYTSDKDGK